MTDMAGKKVAKTTGKEEHSHEQRLEYFIQHDCNYVPSPPDRCRYKVGDEVDIGALQDVIIVGVYNDGKVYELQYTSVDNNRGNPIVVHNCTMFVHWLRVRKVGEDFRTRMPDIKNKDLSLNYMNGTMGGLLHKVYSFGTDMNPEYQRGYVWEQSDKEELIQSVFDNIDIGKFVFVKNEWDDREDHKGYEILDGKQRLGALCEFYEERLAWNGRYYSELTAREQNWFENFSVAVAEMRNADRNQKIAMFLKVNKTGKVMDKEHLRNVEKLVE